MKNTPISTYRVQVNKNFKLSDLDRILGYLQRLGITTIYCAPFFKARAESVHGYDVTNPHIINDEIGSIEEFEKISGKLRDYGMTWLQDIVPNHMAFDSSNPWLMDIFEKGKHSPYYRFFDIDWEYTLDDDILHEEKSLKGRVMAPFLGGETEELIKNGEIKIGFDNRGFFVKYYSIEYPLSWKSYWEVLSFGKKYFNVKKDEDQEHFGEYRKLLKDLNEIQENFETSFNPGPAHILKEILHHHYTSETRLKGLIDHCLYVINDSPEALQRILDKQIFKLVHWRTTESKINYRRFFTINDLICLRIEDPQVFDQYHTFIKSQIDKGYFQGLRIDHIDGLFNPEEYVRRLRNLVGEDVYIIVEKILESEEELQDSWQTQGTSGYEFLSEVNRLFTQEKNKSRFTEIYQDFINNKFNYEDLVFEKKMFILKEKMGGELDNLLFKIQQLRGENVPENLREGLAIFLACFPIYRVYPTQFPINEWDTNFINTASAEAGRRAPQLENAINFLKSLFLNNEDQREERLKLVMRTQQFSGPLAAKGVEDTVFYIYNRLISHNEVGDSPFLFGTSVDEFHKRMQERSSKTPLSINATATHDTKRGEDARMRINALSEIPEEWTSSVFAWKEINKKHKKDVLGKAAPDANDEYFIYQTLIGGFPMEGNNNEEFVERVKEYLIKVTREAKVNTDWSEPNTNYENAVTEFIDKLLDDQEFLNAFVPLFEKVKDYGIMYSLGQTLLKVTGPGIPDTYQGCELWDLSFVDPDNRRDVDYEQRQKYLDEIETSDEATRSSFIKEIISSKEDGRIKLFTLYNALILRKQESELFLKGEYIPLVVSGKNDKNVVAFARKHEEKWALVVVPKSIGEISKVSNFGLGETTWGDTSITLPLGAPKIWRNTFTNKSYESTQVERSVAVPQMLNDDAFIDPFVGDNTVSENRLLLKEILDEFPVSLLTS